MLASFDQEMDQQWSKVNGIALLPAPFADVLTALDCRVASLLVMTYRDVLRCIVRKLEKFCQALAKLQLDWLQKIYRWKPGQAPPW